MARHIPPRRVPRDRFVFSPGSGSAGGIFGGASIPGAHTHLEIDITDLDKFSQAAADARFAAIVHTHLEADITDLKAYLELAGGTMSGDLILNKDNPVITLDATGVSDSAFSFAVVGVSRFIMGFESLSSSYKLNIGGSLSARSDLVMDGTGKVTFGTTPEVGGTAVSLVGHTHLEADITDLQNYSLVGHTHIFANLTDSIANGQVPVGSVTQHEAALAIAFSQITGTVDADLLDGLDSTAFALASHTHLEADITDLKAYLELAGGTMTGNLTISKTTPGILIDAIGTSDSFIVFQDDAVGKFIMGWDNSLGSFKLNIGASIGGRSDFLMDAAGKVTFGVTPEVGGTAVSLVGHTHLEADITDLKAYLELAGGTMTGNLTIDKSVPGITLDAVGTSDSFIVFQDDAVGKFIMGWDNSVTSWKLNIGASIGGRNDLVMDATGKVTFGVTPEVSGTAVLTLTGGTLTGDLATTSSTFEIRNISPRFRWDETDAGVDEKRWEIVGAGGSLRMRTINDASSATVDVYRVTRTGTAVDQFRFFTDVMVNGKFGVQGTFPIAKPTVTGSRGANAALASLLTALANYGLITDSTT